MLMRLVEEIVTKMSRMKNHLQCVAVKQSSSVL